MNFAKRMNNIRESATFFYSKLVRERGEKIINLTIGRTNFDTPKKIKDAAKKALDEGKVHYTPSKGIPELRKKIAEKLEKENKISPLTSEDVIVSSGAKQIIFEAITVLIDKGDKVAIPDPGWVSYEPIVRIANGKVVSLPLKFENDFLPGEEFFTSLENEKPKVIILNSPNNPTGMVYPEKVLRKIVEIAEKNDSWIISDEIYEKIIYEGKHFSPGSIYDKCITVNGFSKEFSMTGWRLGYGACKILEVIEKMNIIQQQTISCATSFAQYGALKAFDNDVKKNIEKMVNELKIRRNFLIEKMSKFSKLKNANGTFYVFPYFGDKERDDVKLFEKFLENGVGVIPGSAFGSQGKGCVRISYGAIRIEKLKKAVERIEEIVG